MAILRALIPSAVWDALLLMLLGAGPAAWAMHRWDARELATVTAVHERRMAAVTAEASKKEGEKNALEFTSRKTESSLRVDLEGARRSVADLDALAGRLRRAAARGRPMPEGAAASADPTPIACVDDGAIQRLAPLVAECDRYRSQVTYFLQRELVVEQTCGYQPE